jgi:hypothetical protein
MRFDRLLKKKAGQIGENLNSCAQIHVRMSGFGGQNGRNHLPAAAASSTEPERHTAR